MKSTQDQLIELEPFGLLAESDGQPLTSLNIDILRQLVLRHRLVVLRGFAPMERTEFEAYAAGWGEILRWPFGAILDVVVDPQARNYLFTTGSVPHHWDGAFAEAVPFLQLFQCLQSGPPGCGGETVFCDTPRLLASSGTDRWADLTITYETDKLAHYGGRIQAPLLGRHPLTGETTLRFAEPPDEHTAPLNPLHLSLESGDDVGRLVAELRPLLYDRRFCYEHAWQAGDYLIADNHALLHARRPFRADVPRHLQRIHIL